MKKINTQDFLNKLMTLRSGFLKRAKPSSQNSQAVLACDFGSSKIVFLELQKDAQGIVLTKMNKMSRPKENVSAAILECFEKSNFSTNKVRIAVKGQGVVLRFIQFPIMKPEDLRASLTYEAEKYIPFKFSDVLIDFHILEPEVQVGSDKMMNVLLVAVKREEIFPILEIFEAANLKVELVDVDALCVLNALEHFYPDFLNATVGTLDIGAEISTLSVVSKGKPRFIRDVSYGGIDIIKRLKRRLDLSEEDARKVLEVDIAPEPEMVAVLKEGLRDLVTDLKLSLDYYMDQVAQAEPVSRLFIGGGGGYHPIVVETLSAELGFPVEMLDIFKKLTVHEGLDKGFVKVNQGLLPVALGLAVRDL